MDGRYNVNGEMNHPSEGSHMEEEEEAMEQEEEDAANNGAKRQRTMRNSPVLTPEQLAAKQARDAEREYLDKHFPLVKGSPTYNKHKWKREHYRKKNRQSGVGVIDNSNNNNSGGGGGGGSSSNNNKKKNSKGRSPKKSASQLAAIAILNSMDADAIAKFFQDRGPRFHAFANELKELRIRGASLARKFQLGEDDFCRFLETTFKMDAATAFSIYESLNAMDQSTFV